MHKIILLNLFVFNFLLNINSTKAQTIPINSFSGGLGLSFYTKHYENKDLDINLQFRPTIGYFFLNDISINCRLDLDYSKISTGYQVHIESNENLVPYLQVYLFPRVYMTGGTQIDLQYQYVPNFIVSAGYSLFAGKRLSIEPEINSTFSFGQNAVRPITLRFSIGVRYYSLQ